MQFSKHNSKVRTYKCKINASGNNFCGAPLVFFFFLTGSETHLQHSKRNGAIVALHSKVEVWASWFNMTRLQRTKTHAPKREGMYAALRMSLLKILRCSLNYAT